jgi:enoyl reductase
MSSVRLRGIGARIVVPSMLLAALGGCLLPGLGTGQALAAGLGSGGVQPPSPEGGASHNGSTYESSIGGDFTPGSGAPWTPPPCWMQPYFPQTQTWKAGDPSGQITDADSYYSWFAGQGAAGASSAAQAAGEFEDIQNRTAPAGWTGPQTIEADDVWWAPNWLNSTTGYACAQGLDAKNQLSNGYIGLEPPLQAGQQSPLTGALNVVLLTQIARADITLPTVSVVTSPAGTATKSAVVNTPTYVAVKYTGDMDPSRTDKTDFDFGLAPLWASVQATITSVTVSASGGVSTTTGFGDPGQTCAAVNGEATPACSVTFSAPSGTAPDNLQVSVTWKVTWSTSAGTGGTFPNTGGQQATRTVVVNEIQSQT